jgi:hypothetical protein
MTSMAENAVQRHVGVRVSRLNSWHWPWVRLFADAEQVVRRPPFGRTIRLRRADVVSVYIAADHHTYCLKFESTTELDPSLAIWNWNCAGLLVDLGRLAWPCERRPRR